MIDMTENRLLIKELEIKEKKTVRRILEDLGINTNFTAIIIDKQTISNLDTVVAPNSKIIILPKIHGG